MKTSSSKRGKRLYRRGQGVGLEYLMRAPSHVGVAFRAVLSARLTTTSGRQNAPGKGRRPSSPDTSFPAALLQLRRRRSRSRRCRRPLEDGVAVGVSKEPSDGGLRRPPAASPPRFLAIVSSPILRTYEIAFSVRRFFLSDASVVLTNFLFYFLTLKILAAKKSTNKCSVLLQFS